MKSFLDIFEKDEFENKGTHLKFHLRIFS